MISIPIGTVDTVNGVTILILKGTQSILYMILGSSFLSMSVI